MKLTIFTPTYNRAYILENLYNSLLNQTNIDFEWIIIYDESIDNTDQLVESWINQNRLDIKYIKQSHGGKHRAINKASEIANGKYMFIVDSDDMLTKDAVEKVLEWIDEIDQDETFCGVSGLKILNNGQVVGGDIDSTNYVDATNFEREKYNLLGDKAEVYRTDLLKKYKFPEFDNEYFVTEEVCYQEIANAKYKIRWYNYPIYICDYLDDGLTNMGANNLEGHCKNYKGFCYLIKRAIKIQPFEYRYLYLKEFLKTKKALKKNMNECSKDLDISFLKYLCLYLVIYPLSFLKNKFLKVFRKIFR